MSLAALDTAAVARALALVATAPDDHAEAYYESRADAELPAADGAVGLRVWRESGLAVRLVRGDSAWLAARDALDAAALGDALRSVARALPPAFPAPAEAPAPDDEPPPLAELAAFAGRIENALRRRYLAFPYRLATRWHTRASRVVTPRTATDVEHERFASVEVRTPWGRAGALAPRLDDAAAEALAERLAARFRAREAAPPERGHPPLLLRPGATAVALHECVAHALEADVLARSGNPLAADGLELGSSELDVLDDPGAAPAGVARAFDDEGSPTTRRWLLRRGRVAQPIADLAAVRRWSDLVAGSGFRADRHAPPLPRSHHLELLAGEASEARLLELAADGLEIVEIASGVLDAATGELRLDIPGARRVRGGAVAEPVGGFRVRGHLAALLGGVVAVGSERAVAGAGWCAKGGQRRAVWATAPSIVVAGLAVAP
jgi:predicted Zn-dependent protease